MNALVQHQPSTSRNGALVPASMTEAVRLAEIMSKANLLPDHLRNKPGDCLLVVMQAQRWGMDAVSVAQCTSVVHGKLCYEGKLVAAALYATGAVEGRLRYEFDGTGPSRSVRVIGRVRGVDADQEVTGCIKDWRTYGKDKQGNRVENAWDKMPDDMLVYRGTRQWARRYAPEAMLGVCTPDEIEDVPAQQVTVTQLDDPTSAELPTYPDDQFDANAGKWAQVIASGKKTKADVVAMVQTKGELTDDQLAKLDVLVSDLAESQEQAA